MSVSVLDIDQSAWKIIRRKEGARIRRLIKESVCVQRSVRPAQFTLLSLPNHSPAATFPPPTKSTFLPLSCQARISPPPGQIVGYTDAFFEEDEEGDVDVDDDDVDMAARWE